MNILIKIVLVFVLLGILAVVSYYKITAPEKPEPIDYEKIKSEYFATQDKMHLSALDDSTRHYIDSLKDLDNFYIAVIDSLNLHYSEIENKLALDNKSLRAENENLKKTTQTTTATQKSAPKKKSDPLAAKVKTEYRTLFDQLPSDLTEYEQKVALNEITVELSQKYRVSPEAVKRYTK